jgi:hypothetical protein
MKLNWGAVGYSCAVFAIAACGSVHQSQPDAALTSLMITATTPTMGMVGAEPGVITATFSTAIVPTSIDATTFHVDSGGTAVPGQVTYDAGTNTATFTPARRLALLGQYSATVTTAVASADGAHLAADYNWSFSIRDGAWGAPGYIDSSAFNADGSDTHIQSDPDGNVLAIWDQIDVDAQTHAWANRLAPGGSWGTAARIDGTATSGYGAGLAIGPSGAGVALLWGYTGGTTAQLWFNRFDPSSGWNAGTSLSGTNAVGDVGVVFLPSGDAVATWELSTGLWGNRFSSGTWGAPAMITSKTGGGQTMAVDANGDVIVTWMEGDGTNNENIWASRFSAGSWGTPVQVSLGNTVMAYNPQVAVDAAGNAIAVWEQGTPTTHYEAWANRFVVGSGWGTPVQIEASTTETMKTPLVGMDSAGNAVAVWQQSDTSTGACQMAAIRFVVGVGWGTAQTIGPDDPGTSFGCNADPGMAVDAAGNAIAMWVQATTTAPATANLYANRFVPATGWSTAAIVDTKAGYPDYPKVAVDPSGRATAVWSLTDAANHEHVRAASFQ